MASDAVRIVARVLTGSTFAILGFDAARAPGPRVQMAGPTLASLRKALPFLPTDDEMIVRANGALQTATGVLIAIGRCQTISAVALFGSLIPTTMAGHSYWKVEDPVARKAQRVQFHKNMAMLGGVLYAGLDGRRSRHASE